MENDFLKQLEHAGFTARIKRLSDNLLYDARKVYESLEMDIEPNWHLIFLILKKEQKLTVTQISKSLGYSHPAIIKIIQKMKTKGYIQSISDENDGRKQLLQLTPKSLAQLPVLEAQWNTIQSVIETLADPTFLEKLTQIENTLAQESLYKRIITKSTYDEE